MKKVLSIVLALAMTIALIPTMPVKVGAASMSDFDFFSKFDLTSSGMENVKSAVDKKDYSTAKKEFVKYLSARKADGTAQAFAPNSSWENYGQAVLPLDNILTGPYEFDVWLNRFTVKSKEYALYEVDLTEKTKEELNNQAISVMLFERQKQAFPVIVASKEYTGLEPVLTVETKEGGVYTIIADNDTYINSGATGTTYGNETDLYVKEQSDSLSSPFGSQTRRAYINFPLTEAANQTVTKATMKLYARLAEDATVDSLDVHVISVGDTMWDENKLTWATVGGNIYSYQNAENPTWQQPSGADNEYQNVTSRFWYARSMAYEYLTYLENPEQYAVEHPLYPDGSVFGEKLISLMDAFATQKNYGFNRTLETGERLNRWVDVLDALVDTPAVQNNPDKVCNIVSFMWGDCNYLAGLDISNGGNWWSNWRIVANAGFYKGNEYFPEWKNYSAWRNKVDYNVNYTLDLLFQDDMSFGEAGPAYAVWCVELFGDCMRMASLNGRPMDKTFTEKLRYAARFAAESIYPDGFDTNIGDSNYKDRMSVFEDLAKFYGNDSVLNAFVNGTDENNPEYCSSIYKNANTMMMRNSWNPEETVYLQFNNNPFDGHAHPDSNSVVMYAYGKPLLVDSGRYSYSSFNSIYNELRYASAHNTVEAVGVSMSSHASSAHELEYAVTNDVFDFAATSQTGYSNATHTRNVMYLKEGFAIVTDYVTGSENREYRQNWHFMPSSNAVMDANTAKTSFYNEANVTIANATSDSAVIRDGYHSADYGLVASAKYASFGKVGKEVKFDTLLYPTKAGDDVTAEVIDLAEDDNSKAALKLFVDGKTMYYYVENTDESDGTFGKYETDAKMAYAEKNNKNVSLVGGKYLTSTDSDEPLIESHSNITAINVECDGTSVNITGENLIPSTDEDAIFIGIGKKVKNVYLNGEKIDFVTVDGDFDTIKGFYAVKSTDISGSGDVNVGGKEYEFVGENLITNGDFKNGTADWTSASNGGNWTGTVSSNYAHGDSKSITNTASAAGSAATTLRRFVEIEGGKTYYLSYYAYATVAFGNGAMSAAVLTKGGPVFGSFNNLVYFNHSVYGGINSWSAESNSTYVGGTVSRSDDSYSAGMNHKEFIFTAPEDAEHIMLSFFAWTDTGKLYLSDFELYEVEEIENEYEVETTVKVEFKDAYGNEIAESITESADENTIYVYEPDDAWSIDEKYYVLNSEKSNLSIKVVNGENLVRVIYDLKGLVTVKHVNEDGEEIASSEEFVAEIGSDFDANAYAKRNLIYGSEVYNLKQNVRSITVSENLYENVITLEYKKSEVAFDGKLAHFTFDDEETGFSSDFANAQSNGTNVLSNDAKRGKSLYLNGSGANYLSVTNADGEPLLTGLDEVTIVFYAKVLSNGANWTVFMAPNGNTQNYQNEHYVGMLHNSGSLTVERYHNSGSRPAALNTSYKQSEWVKYALVIEEGKTTVYVDDVATELGSEYKLSDILGNKSIIQIGKANWGGGEYFNGYIDEFMIYNYALSAKEVADIGGSSKVTVSYVDKNGVKLAEDKTVDVLSGVEVTESLIPFDKLMTVSGTEYIVQSIDGLGKVTDGSDIAVKITYVEAVSAETAIKATKGDSLRSATDSSLSDFASESGSEYSARLMADNRWYKRAGVMEFEVNVPENEMITKATVKLHINGSGGTTSGAKLYDASSLPENWSRGNVTGFALPAEHIATGTTSSGYVTFDVTDCIKANGNVSFAVFTTVDQEYIIFDSENTSYVPELIVTTAKAKTTSFEIKDNKAVYTSYDGKYVTVTVAYYDINGSLIKAVSDTKNTPEISVPIEKNVEGAVAYKAFAWSGFDKQTPLTSAIDGNLN